MAGQREQASSVIISDPIDGSEKAAVVNGRLQTDVITGPGGGDGAIQDGANSAIEATVFDYTNSNPLSVRLSDTNGDYVSVGGGTQYAEDAAHSSGDIGTMALVVRKDTGGTLADTDGDYAPLQVDSSGYLRVNVAAGGAGDGAILDGVTSSIKATVLDYTNSNPLAVRLTNTDGDYVSAGAGTQYADGDAAATPTGTVALGHDGSNVRALTTDATGLLQVDLGANNDVTVTSGNITVSATNLDIRDLTSASDSVEALQNTASDLKVEIWGGAKGATTALINTVTAAGTDHNALDVLIRDVNGNDLELRQEEELWNAADHGILIFGRDTESSPDKYRAITLDTAGNVQVDVVSGSVTVTGTVTANAGTNLNTSALALEAGGNLATIAGDTTSIDGKLVSGGGTEAAALRVTVASDSTGVLSVDDNGSSLTIDTDAGAISVDTELGTANFDTGVGTDTQAVIGLIVPGAGGGQLIPGDSTNGLIVNLGANNDVTVTSGNITVSGTATVSATDLDIRDLTATDVVTVTGGAGQTADVKVTLDSEAVTVTGVSTLAEQQTQTTALQLIDDAIFVDDADWTNDTSKHMNVGGVYQASPITNVVTDGDVSPLQVNKLGSLRVAPLEDELAGNSTHVNKYYTATTPTDGIVWSPAAGKRWYITDIFINVSEASTVTLEDDQTGGDSAVWKAELAGNSGWSHSFRTPLFSGEDAADLIITATAGTVYVTVTGYEV